MVQLDTLFVLAQLVVVLEMQLYLTLLQNGQRVSWGSLFIDTRMNDLAPFSQTFVNENWSFILTTRHLFCGLKPTSRFNPTSDEYCNPQCIARHFGLYQHISFSCRMFQVVIEDFSLRPRSIKYITTLSSTWSVNKIFGVELQ